MSELEERPAHGSNPSFCALQVRGQDWACAVPGIAGLELTIGPRRHVKPLPEGDRYLGFLFAGADGPEGVEQALRTAHGHLEIVIGAQE
jgi:L-amino acid ligase C-terminal domain 2